MTEEGHITNATLPLSQDFKALKDQALAYVQLHSSYQWTNLNASDPGVTILDQLCYALTELGYCNDFPIQDILARKDDKLHIRDQFYLPENILTTSPVTVIDYIKYLIDGVTDVDNAVLLRNSNDPGVVPIYNTYLLIDPAADTTSDRQPNKTPGDYVCDAAFVYLNRARNLCELFARPLPLVTNTSSYTLTGSMTIDDEQELGNILQLIDNAIKQYIFAPVIPNSYKQLLAGSETTDTIFDGPRLKSGWISTDMIAGAKKKDHITIYEIIGLIEGVPGVLSVESLAFSGSNPTEVKCGHEELLTISSTISFTSESLTVNCEGKALDPDTTPLNVDTTSGSSDFESNILFGASVDIRTDLPKSRYRDINSYYSIQNTFPDIYPVGSESVDSNASDVQIAQSRQLKGYLTLFDQVLANQFSQLANVEQLFSFRNAMTATPSDRHWYYAMKDRYHDKNRMYPVPYLRFSPTYFFQSLYHVPGIKPVLKGNETFDFSLRPIPADQSEKIEWHRFRLDPYNPYIRELMNIMEEEPDSLRRRNRMLDHLLARHGESFLMINAYIDGSFYTQEEIKDKVIFKSLYLQNLGLLSYNRYKAYNYLQADPFVRKRKHHDETNAPGEPEESASTKHLRDEFRTWILTQHLLGEEPELHKLINDRDPYYSESLTRWILSGNMIDSVFDSEKVNTLEKLHENDARNYSGIELKMSLLFGLKVLYRDLLIAGKKRDTSVEPPVWVPEYLNEVKLQAYWLITRRKGLIMIEMTLLQQCLEFELFFTDNTDNKKVQWQVVNPLDYHQASALMTAFTNNTATKNIITFTSDPPALTAGTATYTLEQYSNEAITIPFESIPATAYSYVIRVKHSQLSLGQVNGILNGPMFIFPDYVYTFTTYPFYSRANFFLENELPVNTTYHLNHARFETLEKLIPAFIKWHDSLIYDSLDQYALTNSSVEAANLLYQIEQTVPYKAA